MPEVRDKEEIYVFDEITMGVLKIEVVEQSPVFRRAGRSVGST